ncbi:hypothetical protein RQP46_010366 [Phenoliferia psychrophenolica]
MRLPIVPTTFLLFLITSVTSLPFRILIDHAPLDHVLNVDSSVPIPIPTSSGSTPNNNGTVPIFVHQIEDHRRAINTSMDATMDNGLEGALLGASEVGEIGHD